MTIFQLILKAVNKLVESLTGISAALEKLQATEDANGAKLDKILAAIEVPPDVATFNPTITSVTKQE